MKVVFQIKNIGKSVALNVDPVAEIMADPTMGNRTMGEISGPLRRFYEALKSSPLALHQRDRHFASAVGNDTGRAGGGASADLRMHGPLRRPGVFTDRNISGRENRQPFRGCPRPGCRFHVFGSDRL